MRWWIDHYKAFFAHLREKNGEAIVDDRQRCTIYDLRGHDEQVLPDHGPALAKLADGVLGYGGHHRMAFRRFHAAGGSAFPRFARDASGYKLVDTEGNTFVDWVNGGGPVILGYSHPAVSEAIVAQLPAGPTLSVTHPIEVEVASLLTKMVPCAEMVAFGKNGSDAVAAAVRLARAVTGRETILQYGGHGFHDWSLAADGVPGVPRALGDLVHSFPYNDLGALETLLDEHVGEVAAVVMEPLNIEFPEPGYLEGVKELTRRYGALLVFDEVITSFRLARGGAQERFGVVPDLACLGKAMANGMPLSAVVGRREHMQHLPQIAYGMTFRGETLSLAAARAVLRVLQDVPVAEHLERIGGQVRSAFERACDASGVRALLMGPEARMTFVFGDDTGVPHERLEAAFVLECARRHVLTNANILPSLAHDDEAVRLTEEAFGPALKAARELVDSGADVVGRAIRAGFERHRVEDTSVPAMGCIDAARDERTRLILRGWLLPDGEGPCTVELSGPHGATVVAERVERPDVAAVHGAVAGALQSGFSAYLPSTEFAGNDGWEFAIRAYRGDETLFSLNVTRPLAMRAAEQQLSRFDEHGTLHL
jgi:glutamate-1-semialdehyde aminotransferase